MASPIQLVQIGTIARLTAVDRVACSWLIRRFIVSGDEFRPMSALSGMITT